MADTGEAREIKSRADVKESGGGGGIKEVVAKVSDSRTPDIAPTPSRRQEGSSANELAAEWLQVTRVTDLAPL
jgi:hypothetical protein